MAKRSKAKTKGNRKNTKKSAPNNGRNGAKAGAAKKRFKYARTLYTDHIGECVDACIRAARFAQAEAGLRPRERRFAIASVVHGYTGLEAVANIFKFEAFDNKGGRNFTAVDACDVAVKRLLKDWTRVRLEDRCAFLMRTRQGTPPLQEALRMHILEVRELRNLLAHGYVMPGVILFDGATGKTSSEISHPRGNKFPRLKFSRPDKLVYRDARKALGTVLHGVHCLAHAFGNVLDFVSYELRDGGEPRYFGGGAAEGPIEEILCEIDASIPS